MNELAKASDGQEPERFSEARAIELGQWYWVIDDGDSKERWLGCVMDLGSNYVYLESPRTGKYNACWSQRVHLDGFSEVCTFEPNAAHVIRDKVAFYKAQTQDLLIQIRDITANLGVSPTTGIEESNGTRSLSVLGASNQNMKSYKKSLIKAKEKTLPDLFKEVEDSNQSLIHWMSAEVLPMKAAVGTMDGCIATIEERIFHVELYAGLTEDIVQIQDGPAASIGEKVRLMQGRLYMDEECLIDYDAGGMTFRDIKHFDKWLLRPHNIAALLPHQRCMVAFRVRRKDKDRGQARSISEALIHIQMEQEDKFTFLYIRNGQKMYRISTAIELRDKLFPDQHEFNFDEALMADATYGRITPERVMPKREFDARLAESKELSRLAKVWKAENPGKSWIDCPHEGMSEKFSGRGWQPFDQSSVYYDDIKKTIEDDMKQYNRIVLILQGLFDRSPVFAPHTPAELWSGENFSKVVELVYDRDRALYAGEKPDFEVFRAQLNSQLKPGSVVIGMQRVWRERKAAATKRDYHGNVIYRYEAHSDPGPSFLMTVLSVRNGVVKCEYTKPRQKSVLPNRYSRHAVSGMAAGDPMQQAISAPVSALFNASAYTPGDYKLFFSDPRTRLEYIKWAPFLLGAEDFRAGKRKVGSDER